MITGDVQNHFIMFLLFSFHIELGMLHKTIVIPPHHSASVFLVKSELVKSELVKSELVCQN